MHILKHKLKGNTMIEVLIALAILAVCSGLAVTIYINIQKSSLPFFKIKAVELAEFYMNKTIKERDYSDNNFSVEEFIVKRSTYSEQRFPDCKVIRIIVLDVTKKKIHELEQTAYIGK